jgi:DNA-binding response OmpR family regulator
VEDEQSLGKIVTETLEKLDFEVRWETDGKMVMGHISNFVPDICILDIMLPNIDGYTLCKEISSICPALPIIFLTARVETADLIKGFEAGGTDYIRKPFSLEELVVRINNQFRIKGIVKLKPSQISDEIKIGLFTFFPRRYELHTSNGIIKLSQREIQVLNHLVSNLNHVVDRKNLLLTVWGDDSFFNSRNLDVYIRKLRQYFKEDPSILIQTLKGKGYLFLVPQDK